MAKEEPMTDAEMAAHKALAAEVAAMQATIDAKADERKELAAKDYKDRHWSLGALLLGVGVSFSIEGPVNTCVWVFTRCFVRSSCVHSSVHALASAPEPDHTSTGHDQLTNEATLF